jgi:hypothetical protein
MLWKLFDKRYLSFDCLYFFQVSNFFSVICRLFYTFISKMEKRFNLFVGRDHQDGQTSVLFVITITWFIFGTIYVIVNMVREKINIYYNFLCHFLWIIPIFCLVFIEYFGNHFTFLWLINLYIFLENVVLLVSEVLFFSD